MDHENVSESLALQFFYYVIENGFLGCLKCVVFFDGWLMGVGSAIDIMQWCIYVALHLGSKSNECAVQVN